MFNNIIFLFLITNDLFSMRKHLWVIFVQLIKLFFLFWGILSRRLIVWCDILLGLWFNDWFMNWFLHHPLGIKKIKSTLRQNDARFIEMKVRAWEIRWLSMFMRCLKEEFYFLMLFIHSKNKCILRETVNSMFSLTSIKLT